MCTGLRWYAAILTSWFFFFSSRRRHTILVSDWSSDVCSSDLAVEAAAARPQRDRGERRRLADRHCRAAPADLTGRPLDRRLAEHLGLGADPLPGPRSEERRVGKEGRSRWTPAA